MNMPVQNRKYFIARHNHDCEEQNKKHGGESNTITGEATLGFSQISMNDYKRLGPR